MKLILAAAIAGATAFGPMAAAAQTTHTRMTEATRTGSAYAVSKHLPNDPPKPVAQHRPAGPVAQVCWQETHGGRHSTRCK